MLYGRDVENAVGDVENDWTLRVSQSAISLIIFLYLCLKIASDTENFFIFFFFCSPICFFLLVHYANIKIDRTKILRIYCCHILNYLNLIVNGVCARVYTAHCFADYPYVWLGFLCVTENGWLYDAVMNFGFKGEFRMGILWKRYLWRAIYFAKNIGFRLLISEDICFRKF